MSPGTVRVFLLTQALQDPFSYLQTKRPLRLSEQILSSYITYWLRLSQSHTGVQCTCLQIWMQFIALVLGLHQDCALGGTPPPYSFLRRHFLRPWHPYFHVHQFPPDSHAIAHSSPIFFRKIFWGMSAYILLMHHLFINLFRVQRLPD